MHVRVRMFGKPDTIVVVESKLTKMEQFRKMVKTKFNVEPKLQRLFYGGKLLENGYTFHDYNIKLNDVIQLMVANLPQEDTQKEKIVEKKDCTEEKRGKEIEYKDAESTLYAIGDLVDVRDINTGAWLEGTLVKIVHDPIQSDTVNQNRDFNEMGKSDSDKENNSQDDSTVEDEVVLKSIDTILLYKINLDADEGEASVYCKLKDFRPRARKEIEIDDLKAGQKVMINHNTEEPLEKGYWYDFKVDKVKKLRTNYELIGTIYLGQECVPQNDTRVRVIDKIFAIEEVVPLAERTDEYKTMMTTQPTKRAMPLNCLTCRDDKDAPCKDCGCYLCCGKENPEKIVLCDECNNGYHMVCLTPPLEELPEDDWYCPMCKRDPTDVVAPGAAKQTKKANVSRTSRDWGRGMACVGKTKTCAMPSNHFGPIPGIEVGMRWKFRIQLSETGVHRPPISGIHGRDVEGAYSIVLSGGYEDDVDNGNEFTYTGSGGRDLSGNKRTAAQSCDQTLTRENRALARNCAVSKILDEGGDSGDKWREGKPVRVVRSYKMLKHFPEYAPNEGIRYDGIYKVVKYYPETGLSGFRVWKYLLRRDDPSPAPWEPGAIEYPIIYPDGYLEAEAERQALKKQKSDTKKKQKNNLSPVQVKKHKSQLKENPSKDQIRKKLERSTKTKALQENNQSFESEEVSSPEKIDEKKLKPVKRRREASEKNSPKTSASEEEFVPSVKKTKVNKEKKSVASNLKIPSIFQKLMASAKPKQAPRETELFAEDKNILSEDSRNAKLWKECMEIGESKGRTEFLDHVTNVFICIICQQIVARPVTTPCLHNFCYSCLNQACKSPKGQTCPCCRNDLSTYEMEVNEELMRALRHLLPGYDSGRK